MNKIFFREKEQIFIFKYLNLYVLNPCLAQKELFIEDFSHLGKQYCVRQVLFTDIREGKKSVTENGQID